MTSQHSSEIVNHPVDGDSKHIDNDAIENKPKNALDQILAGEVHNMTAYDRATVLSLAQAADPGLPPWSFRMLQFVGIVLVVCMCSGDNGESRAQTSDTELTR